MEAKVSDDDVLPDSHPPSVNVFFSLFIKAQSDPRARLTHPAQIILQHLGIVVDATLLTPHVS